MELTLLDLNTWLMPKPLSSDNRKRISRFVELVKKLDPDIITLQEVWLIKDEKLLRKSLKHYHVLSSGKKRFNNSGLVILSKLKPRSEKLYSFKRKSWMDKLARKGYLVVQLKFGGRIFHLLNTHLHASRRAQPNLTTIFQFLQLKELTRNGSWIVAGDLNMNLELLLWLNLGHFSLSQSRAPTYSSQNKYARSRLNRFDHSDRKVDYVMVRPEPDEKLSVKTRVIKAPLMSDHYALFSVIKL